MWLAMNNLCISNNYSLLACALGYIDGAKAKHIGFGLVLSDGEKMSTRKGTLIKLEELIKQSVEKSKEILRQKTKN